MLFIFQRLQLLHQLILFFCYQLRLLLIYCELIIGWIGFNSQSLFILLDGVLQKYEIILKIDHIVAGHSRCIQ